MFNLLKKKTSTADYNKKLDFSAAGAIIDATKNLPTGGYGDGDVEYSIKTPNGTKKVKPSEIIAALNEQANQEPTDITPPEEDLQGWSVINARDENGKERPLFLMRVLPNNYHPSSDTFKDDDINIAQLVMRDVYGLTPSKIAFKQFKVYIKYLWDRIFKRRK